MIKIDMEMPESCISCGRYEWSNFLQKEICAIDLNIIDFEGKKSDYKSENCPLIEVKE